MIPKRLLLPETAPKPAPPIDYPAVEFTFLDLIGPNRLYYVPCKQSDWDVWDGNKHGYFNVHNICLSQLEIATFWKRPDGSFRNASIIMGGRPFMLKHDRTAQRMYELCLEKEEYGRQIGRSLLAHWTENGTLQRYVNRGKKEERTA